MNADIKACQDERDKYLAPDIYHLFGFEHSMYLTEQQHLIRK